MGGAARQAAVQGQLQNGREPPAGRLYKDSLDGGSCPPGGFTGGAMDFGWIGNPA